MLTLPLSGVTIPAIARKVVVFPEPDRPNKIVIPSAAVKATSRVKLPLLSDSRRFLIAICSTGSLISDYPLAELIGEVDGRD